MASICPYHLGVKGGGPHSWEKRITAGIKEFCEGELSLMKRQFVWIHRLRIEEVEEGRARGGEYRDQAS